MKKKRYTPEQIIEKLREAEITDRSPTQLQLVLACYGSKMVAEKKVTVVQYVCGNITFWVQA